MIFMRVIAAVGEYLFWLVLIDYIPDYFVYFMLFCLFIEFCLSKTKIIQVVSAKHFLCNVRLVLSFFFYYMLFYVRMRICAIRKDIRMEYAPFSCIFSQSSSSSDSMVIIMRYKRYYVFRHINIEDAFIY